MARGGRRRPANPAAVSGPGAHSQRTDGGPGKMEFSGLPYGDNKAMNELASAAPTQPQQGGGSQGGGGRAPMGPEGVFGPTSRPGEPMTAGVDFGPGAGRADADLPEEDPNMLLRAIITKVGPHPDLLRLLSRG